MNRKFLLGLIVILTLCICLVLGGTGILVLQSSEASHLFGWEPTPTVLTPIRVPGSSQSSSANSLPIPSLSSVSTATLEALARTEIPPRDLYQIVPRLRKNPDLAKTIPTPTPRTLKVGDKEKFFVVENAATGKYRTVTATLQIVTPNGYFWVEDGLNVDRAALQKSADLWEKQIYPTNVKYFGDPGRGLDGDSRVHILSTRFQEAAGYFSSVDTYPRALVPFSNERHLIYMNAEAVRPGSNEFNGDLAHEFQHLIHNRQAKHNAGWMDEGMSDLAIKLNGYPVLGVLDLFARNYDTQLNTWANSPNAAGAHYAASYLFFNYVAQRWGPDFIRALIHAPREGINGFQGVLDQRANGLRFDDLFADWAITNYLNDPSVENGRYAYANESMFRITRVPSFNQYPGERAATMQQYAASYLTLQPASGDVTVYFTGTTTVKLLATNAYSGQWMWYSNRADMANMTLTRQFDLTKVNRAMLQFWTWYDIEANYDYAYVEVSTDGGKTWDILKGKFTTNENPNGANYGEAFTGKSGVLDDKASPQWVREQIDLTPYAGKNILLRFEYITDDAYNTPGWAIDDITIPEINYSDNVENGEGDWQAAGFIRTDNVLPQKYIVQLIQFGSSTRVIRVSLDSFNRGNVTINGFGKDISRAALVVTAHAPTTTEPTEYQVGVAPK